MWISLMVKHWTRQRSENIGTRAHTHTHNYTKTRSGWVILLARLNAGHVAVHYTLNDPQHASDSAHLPPPFTVVSTY